jgi:maltose O-acetyltransferase
MHLPVTLWSRLHIWRHARLSGGPPEVTGRVWVRGGGTVRIGDRVHLDASMAPIELHAGPGAQIVLGDGAYVGGGSSIEAQESVTIGASARLEPFCKVIDNHFHPLRGDRHAQPASLPVVIGPGASLGRRAIVLPGARVREGARIAPGAVVRGPPRPAPAPPREAPTVAASSLGTALAVVRSDPVGALHRIASVLRARWLFRTCERGARPYAGGWVRVRNHGRIAIGERAAFVGGMIPTELVSHSGGSLEIGARTVFNYGASIEAFRSVRIGSRCMLASQVRICDRGPEGDAPIEIGDEVWIAHGVTVCPGVTIGSGSVISAGSVVTRDVPAGSLAAGNPARSVSLGLVAPARPN